MFENYLPFYYGGIGIAIVALLSLVIGGDYLGVTRGYVSICSIFSKNKVFHTEEIGGPFGIRTFFAVGVFIGGFLAAFVSGTYLPSWSLGIFDEIWGSSIWTKAIVLGTGGFLWGLGSRLAKGCTAGNSISGISRGSLASIVTTICFLISGSLVIHILEYLVR